jgi:hypothetical protein
MARACAKVVSVLFASGYRIAEGLPQGLRPFQGTLD